jgi:cytochrome P450
MTLFLAGHETTANALAWAGYLLAQHPAAADRLAAEVREAVGDRPPAAADLPRLAYTERVVLESMRLYPPVYAFGREALDPVELGNFTLPRGATVLMSQWVVHRDPRWYDRPGEFDPDRWAGEDRRRPRYAYFPFGGGPRGCVGNTFAMIEATLVLATVVPRFRFTLVPGHPVKPWASVTLRPAHGIRVSLARRGG